MAQQQKTDSRAAFEDLTPQEQEFILALTVDKLSAGKSYAKAFNAHHWTPGALRVAGCRLKQKANVALTLAALTAENHDAATLSLEEHLTELDRLSKAAELAGNYGAAVQAQQLRGKAIGLYIERSEDVTDRKPQDLVDKLAEISPELAAVIARDMGVKQETTH